MSFFNKEVALPVKNTSTALIATNPILQYGQIALETDTNRTKSGDGTSTYTQLTYTEWSYEIVEAAGTNTYTGNFTKPFFLAYFPLLRIRVRFANANTGASTINLNALGAKSILKNVSSAIVLGDILAGGIYHLHYDGTNFQLESPSNSSGAGTVTSVSVVTNQGVSGSVANPTTTPAITLTLGALTGVTSLNGLVVTANTGVITTGTWNATVIGAVYGGTDQTTVTTGDLLYGSAANTWSKLADVATGSVLVSGGVGVAPAWSASPTITTSVTTPILIGSTSASGTLTLRATSSATDGAIIFQSDPTTETARILSTGELLVGGTFSSSALYKVQAMASAGFAGMHVSSWSTTDTHYGVLAFLKSNSATIGTGAATADLEDLGQVQWVGYNSGNTAATPASIKAVQAGAAGATFIGADIVFLTGTNAAARTDALRISSVHNISIGGTAVRATTVGTNALQIFDGTAPVGTLANGCSFYSTAGEMRVMDAAGNATLLSPHEKKTNYWIYDSVDTTTGKRLKIDMEQFMKWLNKKFKTDFVHEYIKSN